MYSPLLLRKATVADLDLIMEMERAGFAAGDSEAREVYAHRIAHFPQGSLMAMCGDRVAGCLFAEIWADEAALVAADFALGHDIRARHVPTGRVLYIASMTLMPAFRGRGLGGELLESGIAHIMTRHPQLREALLLVNETWTFARRIYTAAGFTECGRLPGFFQPDAHTAQDGIVMRRLR
ncbi:GNAT family N-acetyltransferase [Viridibacterium curvum]|uniref:N-acetyltransferase domain-containing protein n=1 Tax=Viridibacterium curvum TaxID=1101404 RepID=A0ABP9QQG4_9RHOO